MATVGCVAQDEESRGIATKCVAELNVQVGQATTAQCKRVAKHVMDDRDDTNAFIG